MGQLRTVQNTYSLVEGVKKQRYLMKYHAPSLRLVTIFLVASLITTGIVLFLVFEVRQLILDETKKVLQNHNSVVAQALEAYVKRTDSTLTFIANELGDNPKLMTWNFRNELLKHKKSFSDIAGFELRIMDANGQPVTGTGNQSSAETRKMPNCSHRDYFVQAKESLTDELVISEPFVGNGPRKGKWLVVLARRITSAATGEFLGVAIAGIETAYFTNLVRSLNLGFDDSVSIASGKRHLVLARIPELEGTIGKPFLVRNWDRVLSGEIQSEFRDSVSPYDGIRRFNSMVRVANYPLVIRGGRGIEAQLAPWRKQSAIALISLAATMLAGIALIWRHLASERRLAAHHEMLTAAKQLETLRILDLEKQAREASERANHSKDEFLATLSHELRTPLTTISMWTQMLREGSLSQEKIEQAYRSLEQNAAAQAQLIDDLLDVSRIISGKLPLNRCEVDSREFVSSAIESIAPLAQEKGLTIEALLKPSAGTVNGDPVRLRQIIWNLLSNAIKFSSPGGRITVRLDRLGESVRIQVTDQGRGINADFLPRVFDRFSQADSSSVRQFGGLGLGLAIVHDLVEQMDGRVSAESAGEGRGATFTVIFPLVAKKPTVVQLEKQEFTMRAAKTRSRVRLDATRILMVDDNADARAAFSAMLSLSGAIVKTAATVAEAIDEVENFRPHVLVSDISMPDEDGYDLIRKIRAREKEFGGHTPAIAMTAYAGADHVDHALVAGFDAHLAKPIDWSTVAQLIDHLTKRQDLAPPPSEALDAPFGT